MNRSAVGATIAGIAAAALVLLFWLAPTDPDRQGDSPLVGRPAPDVAATTTDGEPISLADYRGRWVVVNFFGTWCIPCREEHPELVAWSESRRADGDGAVLSVAYDDAPSAVARFFEENGGDWPVVADGADRLILDFGVVKLPESYLVDPDGVVVHKFVGGVRAVEIDAVIDRSAAVGPSTSLGAGS